jgi:hypothetical protein
MNALMINNCATSNEAPSSTRAMIQVIYVLYLCAYYVMIYSCILMVNYMITDTYFDKKEVEEKVEEEQEEEVEKEEDEVDNAVEEVVAVEEEEEVVQVVPLQNDVNTWYTSEDGLARYKGEWKNGLPNGKGIKHFYKTDSYIDGNFVDGFAEGHCKQTFEQTWEKTVPYYEGEFKRNNYQGKGEYHYGDGDYYKGMWKDGKYHGQGAAYSKRLNRTWVGEYKNDEKVEGNWVKGEI